MNAPDLLGYIASGLIVIAMSMTAIVRLRIVGFMGATAMAAYGVALGAWPVVGANTIIAAMHAVQLRRLMARGSRFELQPIASASQWYLQRFIAFYADDIRKTHPEFDVAAFMRDVEHVDFKGFFVLRDMLSSGLFLYREDPATHAIVIVLDYVTPKFRDLKNARFAYAELPRMVDSAVFRRCLVRPATDEMRRYFLRFGFVPVAEGADGMLSLALRS